MAPKPLESEDQQLPDQGEAEASELSNPKKISHGQIEERSKLFSEHRILLSTLFVGAVIMLLLGQTFVAILDEWDRWKGIPLTLMGMTLFGFVAWMFSSEARAQRILAPLNRASSWFGIHNAQLVLLVLAPFLSLAAGFAAGDSLMMRAPAIAIASWVLAIVMLLLTAWPLRSAFKLTQFSAKEFMGLNLLFLTAFFIRAVSLEKIPWLLTGDEGSVGLFSLKFIEGTQNNIFNTSWLSFPSLHFYLQSLSVRTFGRTILAVRITSVFAGALAVVATYHYAKIAFNRRTAVYAAVFLTGFHLHNHFSRIGLNNIWDSLFIALISGAFWSAWTNHKKSPGRSRRSFIVAGMLLGFSQYFYTGSRILFPMLGLLFFIAWLRDREDFQSHIPGIILMLAGTLIVLLPLGMYYGKHPSDFFASMQRVTIFGDWLSSQVDSPGLSAAAILANRIKDAFLVFTHNNLRGWYSPGQPMLLPAPAILFLLGTALILLRGFDLQAAWILFWLLGTIAIKTLSVAPFAQRLVISTPAVAVIIGFALDQIAGWFKSIWPNLRRPIAVVITLILVVACVGDIYFYFFKYTPSKTFSDLNTEVAFEVIHLLQQKPPGTHVYFSGQPRMGYFTHASVQYLCPHTSGEDIPTPLSQEASIPIYDSTVFIFLPDNIEDLQTVQKQHPGGTVDETIGHDGRVLFTAYAVTKP